VDAPLGAKPGRSKKDIEDEIKASRRGAQASMAKADPQTLYIRRPLLNADEVIKWAKDQGFKTTYPADEMHVTVCYSKTPVDWMKAGETWGSDPDGNLTVRPGGPRQMAAFGPDKNCAVLLFGSSDLKWRNEWLKEIGTTSDYPEYQPHVTISQDFGELDLSKVEPYQGALEFGPEVFAPVKENAMADVVEKSISSYFKVSGVDEGLGLVFGWGIVCKEAGQDYTDTQGNHIPEAAMVEAVTDFMKSERVHGDMHDRGVSADLPAGMVVHSFPLTTDIAKAMGIETSKTGWMVATAPDKAMLAKFKSGEYTGFSIGGEHIEIDGKPVAEVA